jgi:UDP-N-acetylmuramoyl-L-alanyl-D-glutamate--2,6-diaminopimelate ligase
MMPAFQQQSGVSLKLLLAGFIDTARLENDVLVSMLSLHSNKVGQDGLFLAVAGSAQHGLQFTEAALKNGATVIVYDPASGGKLLANKYKSSAAMLLAVDNLASYVGEIASRFYGAPSQALAVVGITGTNGKTSVSHYLAQALNNSHVCGVIGTLGFGLLENLQSTVNTTPDAVSIQAEIARLRLQEAEVVAMEVSSHGLDQGRVSGVQFEGAVFTNLSHDHLDYHGTMEAYGAAKLSLFQDDELPFAVVNLDDEFSQQILDVISPKTRVYGFSRQAGLHVNNVHVLHISNEQASSEVLSFVLALDGQQRNISSPLLGGFNVDNLTATVAIQVGLGVSFDEAVKSTALVRAVAGRMQRVLPDAILQDSSPTVVVDFAHTPDALAQALQSLREVTTGELIVVFGCGGDRDADKRAVMGQVASEFADQVIITSDNPRTESPDDIAAQIFSGVSIASSVSTVLDRQLAIADAINSASATDLVLIAGKGHEVYQDIAGVKLPFSDVECAGRAMISRFNDLEGAKGCKQ